MAEESAAERLAAVPDRDQMAAAAQVLNQRIIRDGVAIALGGDGQLERLFCEGPLLGLVLAPGHPWSGIHRERARAALVAERLGEGMRERPGGQPRLRFCERDGRTCLTLVDLTRRIWITSLAAHLIARGAAAAAAWEPQRGLAGRRRSLADAFSRLR